MRSNCLQILKEYCKTPERLESVLQNYDIFEFQECNIMLMTRNQIFYLDVEYTNKLQIIYGKLYQKAFDINFNPVFLVQKGKFEIEIDNVRIQFFLNDDEGTEYQGKSNQIKNQGKFISGRFIDDKVEASMVSTTGRRCRIIIQDAETGEVLNSEPKKKRAFQLSQKIWCKYNQNICERDLDVLDKHNKFWVTSNILDAYCNNLNLESEIRYFSKSLQERVKVRRILIIPSSLTTSFGNHSQAKKLYQNELLEFQDNNFQLKDIYHSIAFIINYKKMHWQSWWFDLQNNYFYLFDSLYQNQYDQQLFNEITKCLEIQEKVKQQSLPNLVQTKQNDGYSCGLHVANFMYYLYCQQFNLKQKPTFYVEQSVKGILKSIVEEIKIN